MKWGAISISIHGRYYTKYKFYIKEGTQKDKNNANTANPHQIRGCGLLVDRFYVFLFMGCPWSAIFIVC